MDIKGRERKLEENGNAEMILWAKAHGSSETQWHRFLETGGTGFCWQ
jgi:hypothetical protein